MESGGWGVWDGGWMDGAIWDEGWDEGWRMEDGGWGGKILLARL